MKQIFKVVSIVLTIGVSIGTIRAQELLSSLEKSSNGLTIQEVEESKKISIVSKGTKGLKTIEDLKNDKQEEPIEETAEDNGWMIKLNDRASIQFSGELNAYFTNTWVSSENGDNHSTSSIQNGLFPAALMVSPIYKPTDNITITGNFGIWLGLPTSGLDLRNLSLNIETSIGSFLLGRELEGFGYDASLSDISLLGVGASSVSINPAISSQDGLTYTSLNGVGYGYIYVTRLVQINYTTPTFLGTNLTIGIYDAVKDGNDQSLDAKNITVGFHAKLATNQTISDNINLYMSSTFILQELKAIKSNAFGGDIFLKFDIEGLSLAGYFYGGSGIGDVELLAGGTKDGKALQSIGGYGQISYTFNTVMPITVGFHYGASTIEGIKEISQRFTGNVAVDVHSNLILRVDYTNQTKTILQDNSPAANVVAIGATFVF